MMKVLINAYAVCPGMGSEPGVGWHWTTEIAKHCEVFVITESEFKEKILTEVEKLPQKKNLHFFWNEVSPEVRTMCWNRQHRSIKEIWNRYYGNKLRGIEE